jgi:peptidoglycan hydrolase-like amidase/subtilisin family serine protease
MRRLSLLALALPLTLAGSAFGGAAQPELVTSTTFAITGHGYGHGVGMGQWGAYGMATSGSTYEKILAFYYPGTQLAQSPVKTVRVLLADTAGAVTVSSSAPFGLRDGAGMLHQVVSGQVTVDPSLSVQLDPAAAPETLPGPLTLQPGTAPLVYRRPYRGTMQLQVVGTHLQVVNVVGLDSYARGVVTGEMPKEWPVAALQAQAVAARSYAVATLGAGEILYADQRSQVYRGIAGESAAGVQAVTQTKGQVLLYQGQPARTYFSSSSGGRTSAITDLVPGAKPVPYLVSQRDPYDSVSPWHTWGPVVFTGARVSKAFHVLGVTDVTPTPANAHARQIVLTTAAGVEKTLGSGFLRGPLGLRSTFVKVGLLSLSRPAGAVAAGSAVTLTGTVRGVTGTVDLEQSAGDGVWTPGPALLPAQDGTFSVGVSPQQTTLFRLAAPGIKGQPLQVPVAGTAARRLQVVRSRLGPRRPLSRAFVPSDPLATQQWYLSHDHAFDFWPQLPDLSPVLVGVVDTGIDVDHPEFAGKIAFERSFVGGSIDDELGHGTFVAGEIAAALGNGQGVAGIAFPARLIVAKVVGSDQTIDPAVEARAIRWEVDRGAKVINLSLGAVRDPLDPTVDEFSAIEAAAVRYATSHGVLVVAAVGNGDDSPSTPWPYATYPAALPHVLGVGALAQDGSVPPFSNRDPVYTDLVAPGVGILSTFPRSLTALRPTCADQGYSDCGSRDYQDGEGTSFAAPQVSAAAALLLAVHPGLTPDQLSAILEHSADDVTPANGCPRCLVGRDSLSGWGSLDIAAALASFDRPLPAADRMEPNDDAGALAPKLWGNSASVRATADYWDDPVDVYAVRVARGQQLSVSLRGPGATRLQLVLWKPGTIHVAGKAEALQAHRAFQSLHAGPNQRFRYQAAAGGWYDVEVKVAAPGAGAYTLRVVKS